MRVVAGVGPKKPNLVIVGEAPGEEEDRMGIPFVGPSGHLLENMLAPLGLTRNDCYLTNVVKVHPPANKLDRLFETGTTMEMWMAELQRELGEIDCDCIAALGETAMATITGEVGITKKRGSIYPSSLGAGRWVVPTFHPAYILRDSYKMRGVVVEDLNKALRVARDGYTPVTFNTLLRPSLAEVEEYCELIRNLGVVSFDIETVGSGQIACLGLASVRKTGERFSICIPLKHGYNNYWNEMEEGYVWQLVRQLFQTDILKIGQNMNFDLTKLLPFIGEMTPPWFDTMAAHHLVEPELPHTLGFLTSIYTDIPYYKDDPKDEETNWKNMTSSERLWEYNGKDCEGPLIIREKLEEELQQLKMLDFFRGFMMSKVRVLWRIQQRGLLLDDEKRNELLAVQTTELAQKQQELEAAVGHKLNPNSNPEMLNFLYKELKLPVYMNRKTKKPTANKEALEKLFAYHPHPAFGLALDVREKLHEISTYLTVEPEEDGRVRCRYNAMGTTTGRSSSRKNYSGRGLDFHNIPEEDRQMFIAEEGKTFLVRDLWQAEAYVVAALSDCQKFLERLKNGKKIHKLVASWCFNIPEADVDSNNRPGGQYYTGKRVGHGLNYGLGPVLLAINLKATVAKAKQYRDTYFRNAPEIVSWQNATTEQLRVSRQLVTPLGRKRTFRDRWGEDLFKKGYAQVPQSTIGELNHLGMIKFEYVAHPTAHLVQEGYDAVMIEVGETAVEEAKELLEWCFKKRLLIRGNFYEIPGEVSVNRRWLK